MSKISNKMLQFLQIAISISKRHEKKFNIAMSAVSYIFRSCKDVVGLQGVMVSIGRVCLFSLLRLFGF